MPSANGTNGNGTNGHAPVLALEPPAKHPGGRPSDYRPEYCEAVLAWFDGPRHGRVVKKRRTIPQKGAAPAIEAYVRGVWAAWAPHRAQVAAWAGSPG